MYALIFWPKDNTKNILKVEDLKPNVDERKKTHAIYEDGKTYLVMKKSYDKNYLQKLNMTTDGNLMKSTKKTLNGRAMEKKKLLTLKGKDDAMNQVISTQERYSRLDQESPIFNESANHQRSDEEDFEVQNSFDDEFSNVSNDSRDQEELRRTREQAKSSRKKDREIPGKRAHEGENFESRKEKEHLARMAKRKKLESQFKSIERKNREYLTQERGREELAQMRGRDHLELEQFDENRIKENEDPLSKCRKAGDGRVQLCSIYDVWIDKGKLTYLQRWYNSPKEMTRSLLKEIVGKENLKNMCARGRSKKTTAIPRDIMKAVEFYVNKKCTSRLEPSQFTNTVNMMCATLRNPK